MKRLLPAIAILALLVVPQAAQAQAYDQAQLAKIKKIFVKVADEVDDGCLPSPNVLKVEAELILRRSGITVTDDKLNQAPHVLSITAIGGSPAGFSSSCIGHLRFILARREILIDLTVGIVLVSQDGSNLWGPMPGFQEQLRTFVNTATTALANEILKARAQ